MSRARAWLANGILVAASLLFALILAELAVRLVAPRATSLAHQDRYGLALHYPGITRYLPQHGHEVSFNSAGLRDVEHTLEKPDGTFRVLVLGDSFMEALQVPLEQSFSKRIEGMLAEETGRRVEVVNGGVSGWGTDDQLRYLTRYGLAYEPDLVLVAMTLHNDVSDNLRRTWHTSRGGALVEQPREPMSFLQFKVVEAKAFVATHFQLYQLYRRARYAGAMHQTARALDGHVVGLFREPAPEHIEQGFELTDLLLAETQARASAAGARTAVVLLPLELQLSDSIFSAFVQASGVPEEQMPITGPQARIASATERLGIPLIDLLPGFRDHLSNHDDILYVAGDGHWNEAGHLLASKIATEQLVALGLVN